MHVDVQGENQLTNFSGMDVQNENQLTNFSGISNRGKVTESDHSKIELDINLKHEVKKPQRIETYNFKNSDRQKILKKNTTDTNIFSACFKSGEVFQNQI